ncbi:Ger(x)C family germination protein [Bacillus oleivorans]|uniref:Ger(X)C family germination protein n=1 Tax=Bacillus oleivorans TaxID=1448271 RepID=A0A285CTG0_9BACI|nr:Ger(x)C family spore germination protein [Bacillus oleivorans]SNX70346.1 Ger(x)C family germination protein [Bacillus oleivorans]
MKHCFFKWVSLIAVISLLSGCQLEVPLEDRSITLVLGLDLDEEDQLHVYEVSPVFSEIAPNKLEKESVKATTIRDSRKDLDAKSFGEVIGSKVQVLLIGKKIFEQKNWFPILDTLYRNPQFATNTRVVLVDGPVSDIIYYEPEDKPLLPLYLRNLVDKNRHRGRTVQTTISELRRQIVEKGMTPSLSKMNMKKEPELEGIALLDEKNMYAASLDQIEASLLLVLQNRINAEVTFSGISNPNEEEDGMFHRDKFSITVRKTKTKIKTNYSNGQFHFDLRVKLPFSVIERLFPYDLEKNKEAFENIVKEQMEKKFNELIGKIQKNNLDPIGLGLYARAFQYKEYKKVEDHWADVLAEAKINVTVDAELVARGAIK